MKLLVWLAVFSSLLALASAWEKLDHEIFELYDDVKKHEVTTDWYELLGVQPRTSLTDLNKAYRQLSKKYHPDKLRRLPTAKGEAEQKKFQRITLVVNILRDKESRKRYNFFRKNGVPVWRGTGYLYRRWRPGFGTVLVGLLLFVSGMQYLSQHLSYWRAQQRIQIIEKEQQKRGGRLNVRSGEPSQQQMNRRMRRQQKANGGRGNSNAGGSSSDSGFEAEDQMLSSAQFNTVGVINPYRVEPASIKRVMVASLPLWVVNKVLVAIGVRQESKEEEEEHVGDHNVPEGGDNDGSSAAAAEIVRQAMESAAGGGDPVTKSTSAAADPEVVAKRAAKKAAKVEARRRRQPKV